MIASASALRPSSNAASVGTTAVAGSSPGTFRQALTHTGPAPHARGLSCGEMLVSHCALQRELNGRDASCRADPRWRRQRGQKELMQRLKDDFERRGAVLAATLAKDQEPQSVGETLSDEGRGELMRTKPDQAAAVDRAGN